LKLNERMWTAQVGQKTQGETSGYFSISNLRHSH